MRAAFSAAVLSCALVPFFACGSYGEEAKPPPIVEAGVDAAIDTAIADVTTEIDDAAPTCTPLSMTTFAASLTAGGWDAQESNGTLTHVTENGGSFLRASVPLAGGRAIVRKTLPIPADRPRIRVAYDLRLGKAPAVGFYYEPGCTLRFQGDAGQTVVVRLERNNAGGFQLGCLSGEDATVFANDEEWFSVVLSSKLEGERFVTEAKILTLTARVECVIPTPTFVPRVVIAECGIEYVDTTAPHVADVDNIELEACQ